MEEQILPQVLGSLGSLRYKKYQNTYQKTKLHEVNKSLTLQNNQQQQQKQPGSPKQIVNDNEQTEQFVIPKDSFVRRMPPQAEYFPELSQRAPFFATQSKTNSLTERYSRFNTSYSTAAYNQLTNASIDSIRQSTRVSEHTVTEESQRASQLLRALDEEEPEEKARASKILLKSTDNLKQLPRDLAERMRKERIQGIMSKNNSEENLQKKYISPQKNFYTQGRLNRNKKKPAAENSYFKELINAPQTPFPLPRTKAYSIKVFDEKSDQRADYFYKSYKKLQRISDSNQHFNVKEHLSTTLYMPTLNNSKLLPKQFGLAKLDEDSLNEVHFSSFHISPNYAKMVGCALRHEELSCLDNLYLQNSLHSEEALEQVLGALPKSVVLLDLSCNALGQRGSDLITKTLDPQIFQKLRQLNLQQNQLHDSGANVLLEFLISTQHALQKLNIARNQLTSKSGFTLARYIAASYNLNELYVQWNKLEADCGAQIAQAVAQNQYLAVLDLSHNTLASGSVQGVQIRCGTEIIRAATVKQALRHLDLSFNGFKRPELVEIALALKENRTLYGVHFVGNDASAHVDHCGFLHVQNDWEEAEKRDAPHIAKQISKRAINGVAAVGNMQENCWVDELDRDRHLQMSFVEFLEAFARIAEKYSPIPLEENPESWSEIDRIHQKLHLKISNLIALLSALREPGAREVAVKAKKVVQKTIIEKIDENSALKQLNRKLTINLKRKIDKQPKISPSVQVVKTAEANLILQKKQSQPIATLAKVEETQTPEKQSKAQFLQFQANQIINRASSRSEKEERQTENQYLQAENSQTSEDRPYLDALDLSSSSSSSEEQQRYRGENGVNFLYYVKNKKRAKIDLKKAQMAFDIIFQRQTMAAVADRRRNTNFVINMQNQILQLSDKMKINMNKLGIGMRITEASTQQEDHTNY